MLHKHKFRFTTGDTKLFLVLPVFEFSIAIVTHSFCFQVSTKVDTSCQVSAAAIAESPAGSLFIS